MRGLAALLALVAGCSFDPGGLTSGADDEPPADADVADAPDADPTVPTRPDADPGDPVPCPEGYQISGTLSSPSDHSYRFDSANVTFADATIDCSDDSDGQTYVVVIDDATENSDVDGIAGSRAVWLGMSDRAVEGIWITVLDTVQSFFVWDTLAVQPSGGGAENCAELKNGGLWTDLDCETKRRYVCECDPGR